MAVEPEPPDEAAPVVEPGVDVVPAEVLPLEDVPDADEPGDCSLMELVETSQH